MAVYIYSEFWDGAGEGIRSSLREYPTQDAGHARIESLRKNSHFVRAKMLVGSIVEQFDCDDTSGPNSV